MTGISWRNTVFLLLFCCAFFLPGFFTIPPIDRDEPRFAEASRQMLESGDWIDIRFQDQARNKKPIGIYWLQAIAAGLSGAPDQIWPYRIPSFLGATLSVILTASLGALLFSAEAGFIAGLLLAASLLLNTEARMAKTDAMLLCMILCAQLALARTWLWRKRGNSGPLPSRIWLSFWGAIGCGILLKGPIILLATGFTALGLALTGSRTASGRAWLKSLRPWLGLGIALVIVLPWLIAITLRTHGAFFQESLGHDLLGKVAHGQDRGPLIPGLYLVGLPLIFWPGSLPVLAGIPWIWRNRIRPEITFCLVSIVPFWFLFELIPTKLPHYMLPVCPALAILAAAILTEAVPSIQKMPNWRNAAFALWALYSIIFIALSIGLPAFSGEPASYSGATLLMLIALTCVAGVFRKPLNSQRTPMFLGFSAFALYAALFGLTIPHLQTPWISSRIANELAAVKACPNYDLATFGEYDEPSLIFLTKGRTRFFGASMGAIRFLNDQTHTNAECRFALVSAQRDADFLATAHEEKSTPDVLARIDGLNYGHGGSQALTLYRLHPDGTQP